MTATLVRDGRTLTFYKQRTDDAWVKLTVRPDGTGTLSTPAGERDYGAGTVATVLSLGGWTDGYADHAEYLDNIECADCKVTRTDLLTCDQCGVTDCDVATFGCDSGVYPDGMDLCSEHTPSHGGCKHCDPIMPWEN